MVGRVRRQSAAVAATVLVGTTLVVGEVRGAGWPCPQEKICLWDDSRGRGERLVLTSRRGEFIDLAGVAWDRTRSDADDQTRSVRNGSPHCLWVTDGAGAQGDGFRVDSGRQREVPQKLAGRVSSVLSFPC